MEIYKTFLYNRVKNDLTGGINDTHVNEQKELGQNHIRCESGSHMRIMLISLEIKDFARPKHRLESISVKVNATARD